MSMFERFSWRKLWINYWLLSITTGKNNLFEETKLQRKLSLFSVWMVESVRIRNSDHNAPVRTALPECSVRQSLINVDRSHVKIMEVVNRWLIDMFVCVRMDLWVREKRSFFEGRIFLINLGNRCEMERNECEPVNPCLNSGRCIDGLNNFTCICNPGRKRLRKSLFWMEFGRFYGLLLWNSNWSMSIQSVFQWRHLSNID